MRHWSIELFSLLRPDQVRQRELLAREVELDRVAEGDLERVVLPARAALQQELALLADDQQLGRLARAARELDDRVDHPDVEVRQDDGELFDGERLALPRSAAPARCRRPGGALSALRDGRGDGLHVRSCSLNAKSRKEDFEIIGRMTRSCAATNDTRSQPCSGDATGLYVNRQELSCRMNADKRR